jgi:hypothetical protein
MKAFHRSRKNVASNKIHKSLVVTDTQTVCTPFQPTISVTQTFPLPTAIQCKILHRIHALKFITDVEKQVHAWNTVHALLVDILVALSERI